MTVTQVSLAPEHRRFNPADAAPPMLLEQSGARVILGSPVKPGGPVQPVIPDATSMFGPRGVALVAGGGLVVADTGHHRLMIWCDTPASDSQPADLLIGQPDFSREGRNANGDVGASTLNVPTGVTVSGGVLAVADAWNHRILIWHGLPDRNNQPADVVLGQADFAGNLANRGKSQCAADRLNWCYGVAIIDGNLFVADTGNRRVLMWHGIPTENGAPADLVLGERDFVTRDENAGGSTNAHGMRWPHGIVRFEGKLLVSDAGNNRITGWHNIPTANGTPADFVLGQPDASGTDHNHSSYYPDERALNMPYSHAVMGDLLVVADTANSRLVGFTAAALVDNGAATRLAGQRLFKDKGDNRWGFATRDSLCWPYGIDADANGVAIADSGNNRVLLWDAA